MSEEMEVNEVEEKARAQGWNPEYDGPNKKSAEQFLEDGEKINAVLKERMEKILEDNKHIKRELSKKDETLIKYVKHAEEQKKKAVEKAIAKLQQERKAAIREGDPDAVEGFDTEIDNLRKEAAEVDAFIASTESSTPTVAEPSQDFEEWAKENSWYEANEEMTAEAVAIGNQLLHTGAYKTEKALLKAVSRRIKQMFPEEFNSSANVEEEADARMEVETGQRGGSKRTSSKKGKRSYADLPAEAKRACDEFCAEIPGYTKEKYLDSYEWE